jgi:hypothetical protein
MKLKLIVAAVLAAGTAAAFATYVYAGASPARHPADRRRVHINPAALGTVSPRVLNIVRGEREVDASIQAPPAAGLAPGVSAGVSALTRPGRPPASVPKEVRSFVDHTARMTQTDPSVALARLRELRSGLGTTKASLYAYRSSRGSPCFVVTGYGGACAQDPRAGMPGLHWTIGGGHDGVPSILAGIAGDDVTRVELRIDGAAVPVSLEDNAVFAEFPASAGEATIVVVHEGGAESRTTLGL